MAVKTLTTEIKDAVRWPALAPTANSLDLAFTAPTVASDGIDFELTGREVVLIQNSDGANPYTVTLKSVADSATHRTGDIGPYTLQAGEFTAFIPSVSGFRGSNGRCLVVMENVAVKVAVLRMPNTI